MSESRTAYEAAAAPPVAVTHTPVRLHDVLAHHLERLTKAGKPYTITIVYDGEKFAIWEGVRAGLIR